MSSSFVFPEGVRGARRLVRARMMLLFAKVSPRMSVGLGVLQADHQEHCFLG